ncbi:MAG: MFS transporter [Gammaproteobacteria bacterium]|nr:MAG: MFS transporter [Gammaproteobacteria bacterium]
MPDSVSGAVPPPVASSSWQQDILNRRMLICVFTGFSSGLPLYVLIQLVPAWLRVKGVALEYIGLFSLLGLPYAWKFLWAPLLDRYALGRGDWGRRRSWMLLTQVVLLVTVALLGMISPEYSLHSIAILCFAVAFFSATQDIALDAYRRELLPDHELGLGNAIHVNLYRISSLVPGSLALLLADAASWQMAFVVTAAFMLLGIVTTCLIREAVAAPVQQQTLQSAVIDPFRQLLQQHGVTHVLFMLAFLFCYKLGDSMATALATPFYVDMGYTLMDIGLVAKHAALWPSMVGAIVGGLWMLRLGINRALWVFGAVQLVSILGYAILAEAGAPNRWLLAAVISVEYLGVGLGTAAFTAWIARSTDVRFAATQIALFTAVTAIPRTVANASTGYLVEWMGWTPFFLLCTVLAVPGMVLLLKVAPWTASGPSMSRQ